MADTSQADDHLGLEGNDDKSNPGIWTLFGELPPDTIISEVALAERLGKHPVSIKRAILRGELPPSRKMFGTPAWQIGFINEYFTERLREALKETAKKKRSLDDLEP
jgi:hypothetical protein